MAPPPLPPGLMDDVIGEILLRLPPSDPACLVRASLVCKSWRTLVSADRGFLRENGAFHGTSLVLGFFHNHQCCGYDYRDDDIVFVPRFVATTAAAAMSSSAVPLPLPQPAASAGPGPGRSAVKGALHSCRTLDCRHGRVLLHTVTVLWPQSTLTVWDPITGDHRSFSPPSDINPYEDLTGTVLCASSASDGCCDHLECSARGGAFLVVIAGVSHGPDYDQDGVAWARVYSSETAAWGAPTTLDDVESSVDPALPGLLAAGAVYFMLDDGRRILKYDLKAAALSVIKSPPLPLPLQLQEPPNIVFAAARDGELGAATVEGYSLHLWSWDAGVEEWARVRVIDLDTTIIGDPLTTKFDLAGSAQGAGLIFIMVRAANDDHHQNIFTVELTSGHVSKTGEKTRHYGKIFPLMMSFFCTPATS